MHHPIKEALLTACKNYVAQRAATALQAIESATEAATDDTKSSAGDKFETTREMMQQEISRNRQLLADAQRMEQLLTTIDGRPHTGASKLGSMVETNRGTFFLAISLGQLTLGEKKYWVVSTASPIGQELMGRQAGAQFTFKSTTYLINTVV